MFKTNTIQKYYDSKRPGKVSAGFTLAEILITLLIIGVVASIVIPGLINDTQDAELKTAWKKSYSMIDQVTKRIMMDNGGTMGGYLKGNSTLHTYYEPYLLILKDGGTYGLYHVATNPPFNYKRLNGVLENKQLFDDGQLLLNNGVFLAFENHTGGPTTHDIIWVDVNGFGQGPNIIGKDVFGIEVLRTGIKPLGFQGDGYENTCNTNNTGWGCSARYLYQ